MKSKKQSTCHIFALCFIMSCSFVASAAAAVRNVPGTYSTIQAAINAANNGDTVMVADGTYQGVGNRDLDFKGKAIKVRSANGPQHCIIDCQQAGRGVLFQSGETNASLLLGFTIINGRAEFGGGIACNASSPTIQNCIIKQNTSIEESDGGGIAIGYGASAVITKTTIRKNTADSGAGIYLLSEGSSATITNCTIAENHAGAFQGAGYGGGIYGGPKTFGSIENSAITGNIADGWGGGIHIHYCENPSWKIENCTIAGNVAAQGGGILVSMSVVTVNNCSIVNNTAALPEGLQSANGGGLAFNWDYWDSSSTVSGCTISGNKAHEGAGVYLSSSSPSFVNCVITKNKAYIDPVFESYGGGISVSEGSPALTNCTVSQNSATGGGGGIYHPGSGSSPVVANSIFWANTPNEIYQGTYPPTALDITYSNIKGGYVGAGNINANPLFLNTAKSDYHLAAGSPCLNKGSNAATELPPTDKNGNQRIVNGTVDMGAYEYTGSPATAVVRITAPDAAASEPPTVDSGKFQVSRTGDLTTKMTLNLAISGTATNGQDYQKRLSQVTIPAGKGSVNIPVNPLEDALGEGDETVVITILNGKVYEVGSTGVATVTIKDSGN